MCLLKRLLWLASTRLSEPVGREQPDRDCALNKDYTVTEGALTIGIGADDDKPVNVRLPQGVPDRDS